jgi:hypothetical protein
VKTNKIFPKISLQNYDSEKLKEDIGSLNHIGSKEIYFEKKLEIIF